MKQLLFDRQEGKCAFPQCNVTGWDNLTRDKAVDCTCQQGCAKCTRALLCLQHNLLVSAFEKTQADKLIIEYYLEKTRTRATAHAQRTI